MTFKSFVKKFKSEVRTIKIGHSQVLDILRHSGSDLLYCPQPSLIRRLAASWTIFLHSSLTSPALIAPAKWTMY